MACYPGRTCSADQRQSPIGPGVPLSVVVLVSDPGDLRQCVQDHELGAMIVGVIAAPLGWKVIYLGPNLPVEEISAVADSLEAKVVAIRLLIPVIRRVASGKQVLPT